MRRHSRRVFMRAFLLAIGMAVLLASLPSAVSADDDRRADCRGLPSGNQLRQLLRDAAVAPGVVGGLFNGSRAVDSGNVAGGPALTSRLNALAV